MAAALLCRLSHRYLPPALWKNLNLLPECFARLRWPLASKDISVHDVQGTAMTCTGSSIDLALFTGGVAMRMDDAFGWDFHIEDSPYATTDITVYRHAA